MLKELITAIAFLLLLMGVMVSLNFILKSSLSMNIDAVKIIEAANETN